MGELEARFLDGFDEVGIGDRRGGPLRGHAFDHPLQDAEARAELNRRVALGEFGRQGVAAAAPGRGPGERPLVEGLAQSVDGLARRSGGAGEREDAKFAVSGELRGHAVEGFAEVSLPLDAERLAQIEQQHCALGDLRVGHRAEVAVAFESRCRIVDEQRERRHGERHDDDRHPAVDEEPAGPRMFLRHPVCGQVRTP